MAARRLHYLIYVTIFNCCLFLIACGVALGTNHWFTVTTNGDVTLLGGVNASYGLFAGVKTKTAVSGVRLRYDLSIVCKGMEGCMFSCGVDNAQRKVDLANLMAGFGAFDQRVCTINSQTSRNGVDDGTQIKAVPENSAEKRYFINLGLYVATIGFLGLSMIFAIVSGILALYNTYRTPIQPVLSVYGLYFWNGISAGFVLLSMLMWIIEFLTRLRKNAAISDTLSGTYDSEGSGSLGISFWILVLPIVFSLANIAILKYRKWKIVKMDEKNVRVMKGERQGENGDTILF